VAAAGYSLISIIVNIFSVPMNQTYKFSQKSASSMFDKYCRPKMNIYDMKSRLVDSGKIYFL
jgi:hypothetical protein